MVAFNSVAAAFSLAFFALAASADNMDEMFGKGTKPFILGSAPTGKKVDPNTVITATGLRYMDVEKPMFVRPGEEAFFLWRRELWELSEPIADLPVGTKFEERYNVTLQSWRKGTESEIITRIVENADLDGGHGIRWNVPADIEERDDYFLDVQVQLVSDDVKVQTAYWNSFGSSEKFTISARENDDSSGSSTPVTSPNSNATNTSPKPAESSPEKGEDSSAAGLAVNGLSWVFTGALTVFTFF